MPEPWFDELAELIAIPSVSADPEHADDVRRAAEWVRDMIVSAGGEAQLVETSRQPLVIGEVRASSGADQAPPTVLCYNHFDVQPPAPLDLWESDPFTLVERDGWLYSRGIADDKGQLYIVLSAVRALAAEGRLPVNIRIAFEGEEEVGGTSISDWVRQDGGPADACLILDGGMTERGKPEFTVATRGLIAFDLRVRTGSSDLHSGVFGNAGLNAIHALIQCLQAILPRDGRLPEPLRAGALAPSAGRDSPTGVSSRPAPRCWRTRGSRLTTSGLPRSSTSGRERSPLPRSTASTPASRSSTRRSSRAPMRTSRCGWRRVRTRRRSLPRCAG